MFEDVRWLGFHPTLYISPMINHTDENLEIALLFGKPLRSIYIREVSWGNHDYCDVIMPPLLGQASLIASMLVEKEISSSALLTLLVGWHASALSLPPGDVIFAS